MAFVSQQWPHAISLELCIILLQYLHLIAADESLSDAGPQYQPDPPSTDWSSVEISREANIWLQFISCRLTFTAASILDKSAQVHRLFHTVTHKQMIVL